MANILMTPLSIQTEARKYFPDAQIKVLAQNVAPYFQVELKLNSFIPVFVFQNAVVAKVFTTNMEMLAQRVKDSQYIPVANFQIDKTNLFTGVHIKGWQEALRTSYQASGGKCSALFVRYLIDGLGCEELFKMGLAPEQMNVTEESDEYVKEILEQQSEDKVKTEFREKFPQVTARIKERELAKFRNQAGGGGENFYKEILTRLRKHVIGQQPAAERLATLLNNQRTDPTSNQVFLFVGPTGVGKTEFAKAIGIIKEENLKNRQGSRIITLNMQESYSQKHAVSALFGAPPGYVGGQDKPAFAKELDQRGVEERPDLGSTKVLAVSDVVVLFDEFEKAHKDIKQSLLTLFREKYYEITFTEGTNNIKIRYVFESSVFICTSNLFQAEILQSFRDNKPWQQISDEFRGLNRQMDGESNYSSEMLARMGENIIPFGPIGKGEEYQSLIRLKCDKCFQEVKTSQSYQELAFRGEEEYKAFRSTLETNYYGEGIDFAKVVSFFDQLKEAIALSIIDYEAHKKLVKISFYPQGDDLHADFLVYHSSVGSYSPLVTSKKIISLNRQGT